MTREWSQQEVLKLPVVVDLVTAGSVLGMGRSASYEQARAGTFPVPVLRVGCRYRVVTAHIVDLLGLGSPAIREKGYASAGASARPPPVDGKYTTVPLVERR